MSDALEPHPDVFTRRIGDELVLVQLERSEIFSLNSTGARLWELLTQGFSPMTATARLVAEYDVDEAEVQTEVYALVSRLEDEGLLRSSG